MMDFLEQLKEKSRERQLEWDSNNKMDVSFKALELAGEVGELCNEIKKVKREELGIAGSSSDVENLKNEFGDVLITLSQLADHLGIDLVEVTKLKFNKTSDKMGFKTKF